MCYCRSLFTYIRLFCGTLFVQASSFRRFLVSKWFSEELTVKKEFTYTKRDPQKRRVYVQKKLQQKSFLVSEWFSARQTTEPISLCAVAGLFSHTDASCVSLFVYCSSLCKLLAPEWLSTLHETTTWSMHALLRREPFPMSFFQHHRSLFTTISLFSVPQVSLFCNFVSCS